MGLKCTLLGHSFGEQTVTREREERGSEVVTIVREVEECARCGEEHVVTENKEVTSVVDPEEVGLGGGEGSAGGESPEYATGSGLGAGTFNQDQFEPADSPAEEDAEIMEAGSDDRAPGEWPSEPAEPSDADADRDASEQPDDPDAAGADPDDHATVLDDQAGGGDPAQASLDESTAPDSPGGDEPEPSPEDPETGVDDGATVDRGGESLTVPEGGFECPECGLRVDADSSFRSGDACPECQRGYLEAVD